MCELCHHSPCLSGCPNAPEPEAVYTCKYCGEPIVEGEEYLEIDGDYYHLEDCAQDVAVELLIEKFGATKGEAECIGPEYDD